MNPNNNNYCTRVSRAEGEGGRESGEFSAIGKTVAQWNLANSYRDAKKVADIVIV